MSFGKLSDLLGALADARSPDACFAAGRSFFNAEGFAHFNYVVLDHRPEDGAVVASDFRTTMPASWMEEYEGNGYAEADQSIRLALSVPSGIFLTGRDFIGGDPTLRSEEVRPMEAMCSVLGVGAGFSGRLPDPDLNRSVGFFLGDGERGAVFERKAGERGSLYWLALHAFQERMRALGAETPEGATSKPGPVLTDREREVLIRLSLGHPIDRVGDALDIRAPTVSTYVGRAAQKLGTRTSEQTIVAALLTGLISP